MEDVTAPPAHHRGLHGNAIAWAYVGVALLFLYLPLVPPILFSVGEAEATRSAFTLRWYAEMWRNPLLVSAMGTTLTAGLIVALAAPLLGLLAATAIRELGIPRLVLLLMLLPLFIPGVSMGLATAFFFRALGIPPSLLAIAVAQVLWALPFATLVILTVMSTFDPVYLEAAYMSGASRLRAFLDIELPLIWPGVVGAGTFSLILSFNETVRTAIVQGPLNTVQTYIWSTYKQIGLSPTLYALMSLLIVLTLALVAAFLAAGRRPAAAA
jgi:ABC-type spermidine/putrescine transport system permease subunit II